MAVLRAFSLVGTTEREDEFEMHGLVQLATRIWLRSTDAERKWHRAFIQAMAQEFPDGEYANWPKCQTLFPHVLPVVEQEGSNNGKTDKWALLLNNTGWYAWRQGLFAQAEGMVTKALEIRKEILDADDSSTLLSLSLLGSILAGSGKYKEAEELFVRVMETFKRVLGEEHPDTLTSIGNLALTYRNQGRWKEAEELEVRVMETRKRVLGEEHPDTLTTMNNLAYTWKGQGRDEEAIRLMSECVRLRTHILGADHPFTFSSIEALDSWKSET